MKKLFREETVNEVRKKLEEQGLDSCTPNELLVHAAAFFNDEVTTFNEEFSILVKEFRELKEGLQKVERIAKWIFGVAVSLVISVVGGLVVCLIKWVV